MSYTIYKADGTAISVPDNVVDLAYYNTTGGDGAKGLGTQLIGRNTINYGAPVAQNFLQLTENFASLTVPSDATSLQGQLWFKKTSSATGELYVRVSNAASGAMLNWNRVSTVTTSSGAGGDGDLRVDGSTVYIWAAGDWRQIYPAVYS